ncbi:MAG: hypothetical protein ACYTEL_16320 [Planctomycetota bacterium]
MEFLVEKWVGMGYKGGLFYMDNQEYCESCAQKNHCQEVYGRLGRAQGRSVVCGVLAAFLLPMLVFITSLAVFEQVLGRITQQKPVQTGVSLVLALLVTFGCVMATKAIKARLGRNG